MVQGTQVQYRDKNFIQGRCINYYCKRSTAMHGTVIRHLSKLAAQLCDKNFMQGRCINYYCKRSTAMHGAVIRHLSKLAAQLCDKNFIQQTKALYKLLSLHPGGRCNL